MLQSALRIALTLMVYVETVVDGEISNGARACPLASVTGNIIAFIPFANTLCPSTVTPATGLPLTSVTVTLAY